VPDKGDQRKKALHHVHNLRRKNLAELFKTLQGLNLSYKRGMIHIQNFDNDSKVPYDFLTEPMDLSAGWSHFVGDRRKASADKELITAWSGCEEYFQKCIARFSAMTKAFQNPSKELGSNIIDRCKGFIADFFTIICDQKSSIGKVNRHLWDLRVLLELPISDSSPLSCEDWGKLFQNTACTLEYEITQFRIVFESLVDIAPDIKEKLLSGSAILIDKVRDVKGHLSDIFTALTIPLILTRPVGLEVLKKCEEVFVEISIGLVHLQSSLITDSILANRVQNLSDVVSELLRDFKNMSFNSVGNEVRPQKVKARFRNSANNTLESVLLSFQKLKNISASNNEETKIQSSIAFENIQCFDLEKVVKGCIQMRTCMSKTTGVDYSRMSQIFIGLKPMVQQYFRTAQFYLKSLVEYHREACKLQSVLSAVFGTLAQKVQYYLLLYYLQCNFKCRPKTQILMLFFVTIVGFLLTVRL